VLATRRPTLLLRFAGRLLLRYAERTFDGWLLNEPPRNTRLQGRRPAEGVLGEQPPPQSVGTGLVGVADPAEDAAAGVVERDLLAEPGARAAVPEALTALVDGLREIMNEGSAFSPLVLRALAILTAWGVGSFLLALRLFRWR